MGAYEVSAFCRRISVDPVFRARILADEPAGWAEADLGAAEERAIREGNVAWLHEQGANDFLLHHLARFGVAGLTVAQYADNMRQAAE